jgi:SAM-dependent methyltransferase
MSDALHRPAPEAELRSVLHVGSGPANADKLHPSFRGPQWREIRLDIDPTTRPDILADMMDMSPVASGSVDAVWSSHNIEHVYAHHVSAVLREFLRVLKPGGFVLINCPDMQSIAQAVLDTGLTKPAYQSASGPITPHDMIFGFGEAVAAGCEFMAHKTAFTGQSLGEALVAAGFGKVRVKRERFDLWARADKTA